MRVSRTRSLAHPCAKAALRQKPTISPTNSADEPKFLRTIAGHFASLRSRVITQHSRVGVQQSCTVEILAHEKETQ